MGKPIILPIQQEKQDKAKPNLGIIPIIHVIKKEHEFGNIQKSIHYDQNPSSDFFLYHFQSTYKNQ